MPTLRVESRRRFTAVDRKTVNDSRLSFRARGLLVWLLDKPDDWRVNSEDITSQCVEGRDAVRTALRELETAGYISRERRSIEGGRWVTETVVRERPTDDGKPGVGNPDVGEPGANTKTETEDCYPQTPRRSLCFVCSAEPDQPCAIVKANLGEVDACPWVNA